MKVPRQLRLSSILSPGDRGSSVANFSPTILLDVPEGKKKKQPKSKIPAALRTWRFVAAICMMFSLVIALEVALAISVKRKGFPTGNISPGRVQFYSSFIPTLSITGVAYYWRSVDRAYRRMQPYINMAQGPTSAKDSVLLDMEHMNYIKLSRLSFQSKRYLVLISTIFALLGILYHPLASSFFFIKSVRFVFPADTNVQSLATLGLNIQSQDLSSFVAAAGFSEAAAYYNLDDPPFVHGPWAVARFQYPSDISVNSTVTVNTTAIESKLNCSAIPVNIIPNSPQPLNTTLQVDIAPGCSRTVVIDQASSTSQYGALAIANCTTDDGGPGVVSPEFAPVLFWFYTIGSGTGQLLVGSVFCEVSLRPAVVEVTVDGTTGRLTRLNVIGDVPQNDNNVTSGLFAGDAFNGIAFESQNSPAPFNLSNPFIAARALAVRTQIPGAIFRLATDATLNPGGLSANGLLSITKRIYTQYLSVIALGNYFIPASQELVANVTLWPNRLFMNYITVHVLSVLLIVVAFTEMVLYYFYRKQSRNLRLGTRPGFIAHCMSILPHASTSLITPTDDKQSLKRKLDSMRFMLDDDGYIVALPNAELDAVKRSRGASWLSQQKSMLKFHMEPYEEASPFSSKSDDNDTWLNISSKSPLGPKSSPVTPLLSATGASHSRRGSSSARNVRFSFASSDPLLRRSPDRLSTSNHGARGGSVDSTSSGESQLEGLYDRPLPVLPPGLSNPPIFSTRERNSSSSSSNSPDDDPRRHIA